MLGPGEIRIDSYDIDADTAALLEEIYLNGLGEFAYRNGLDLHGKIRLPALKPSPSRGGLGGDGFPVGREWLTEPQRSGNPSPSRPSP